ncbi:hypothetical protein [Aeromonas caviae]|uniref:hypothetical protein n=1 Tax=Aeromonas caviae TaxID=648 RepID=UPI002DD69D3A|nr:hypothetical protein [Aeromonas caviae]
MTIVEGLTLATAVLGAVLGIMNTWQALDSSRVKLRVVPKKAIPIGAVNHQLTFCIEITNLSSFAVTISEAGVFYKNTNKRGAYVQPELIDGQGWPRRLEPRSSVTIYGHQPEVKDPRHPLKCAYARTECGVIRTGTSPVFKHLAKKQI